MISGCSVCIISNYTEVYEETAARAKKMFYYVVTLESDEENIATYESLLCTQWQWTFD